MQAMHAGGGNPYMKLRIVDDSLRLRLTRSEVALIERGEAVESRARFPGGSELAYALIVADATRISATFDADRIEVTLPRLVALPWAAGNEVSLHGEQPLDHGVFQILVEKDFTCVEPREGEDQTDLYPNPKTAGVTAL
jgi:hypothetical protein